MRLRRNRKARAALALGVAGVVAFGAYAFTAANTVENSAAGDGTGTVSGYAITNVDYVLNATNPANIDQVTFDIAPVAVDVVKAQLVAGGAWYDCTDDNAGNVTCDTTVGTQATALAADQLRVVATS